MSLVSRVLPYLRARALWAALFAVLALVWRLTVPAPPPRSPEGVAAMLGAAVGGEVRPDDFVWEERGGFLSDAFLGRRVLFLARRGGAGEARGDLFRARVRLTRAGRPVSLGGVHDLTGSPLGDERELVAHGHHAAVITVAFGAVHGITLLDLAGEAREARTAAERLGASIEGFLGTGSARGVGRTEVTFDTLPAEAKIELGGDLLVMALGKEAAPAALDLRDGTLNAGPKNPFSAHAQRLARPAKALGEVVVEAARELFGPAAGRAIAAIVPRRSTARTTAPVAAAKEPAPAGPPGEAWPPAAIGEAAWLTGAPAGAAALPGAPPALVETTIKPIPGDHETEVHLVALDLRQLELRLAGGFEEPRPDTGIHGVARLPEGPLAERVVAAFTADPADSGAPAPGFVEGGRVLRPLSPGAATVALGRDGEPRFGAWSAGVELLSALQTPDPLLGGTAPAVRPLAGVGERTTRSALGLLPSGHAVYAFAAHADAAALTAALKLAGVTYAVPLASGPSPVGFAYLRAGAEHRWEPTALAAEMTLSPASLSEGSPNSFFYATQRDFRPRAPLPAGEAAAAWAADPGTQPTPAWIPSIHAATVSALGAQIHLVTFAPGRALFRLRAGAKEPQTKAAAALPQALSEAEQAREVAAIGLGVGRRRGARGLVIEGAIGLPLRGEATGVLVLDKGRPSVVASAGFALPAGADATELPLTADEGKLRGEAREVGSMRPRAAACVLADGTFAVASTTFDSDEAATTALLDLGCPRVVALDRGVQHGAFLHRVGTETVPSPRYDPTVITVVDAPMAGRGGVLE